jgi:uncharacterized membrane protein
MTTLNPYAAPKAAVADETVALDADYVPGGQARPVGHGWSWIAEGWHLFKRQPGIWIGIVLVLFAIMLAAAFIPVVGGLALSLFGPVFAGGIVIGCKALESGAELELGHLFAGFRSRTGALVAIGALYLGVSLVVMLGVGLVMGVGMFTMMGADPQGAAAAGITMLLAMLVAMALLLPVFMAIWFAAPLVVLHGEGAVDAMKGSFSGCLKNVLPFLWYSVIFVALAFLASLPLLLGWLVLGPVLAASIYTAYRDIYLRPRS